MSVCIRSAICTIVRVTVSFLIQFSSCSIKVLSMWKYRYVVSTLHCCTLSFEAFHFENDFLSWVLKFCRRVALLNISKRFELSL